MPSGGGSLRTRFGIGEWYGQVASQLPVHVLNAYGQQGGKKVPAHHCPFGPAGPGGSLQRCNKAGGVCSLRPYQQAGTSVASTGDLVTLCPQRFWQNHTIFREIGREVLQAAYVNVVKEVGFLMPVAGTSHGGDVGRIDLVMIDQANPSNWCAVEMQAVYFSGDTMSGEYSQYARTTTATVFPAGQHRPDFRSSGPKRLMPQLQIKVPTLRRWGKKMAVIVDEPFFASMAPPMTVPHLSNSDICWFVVGYDMPAGTGGTATLRLKKVYYTTLESSVDSLTAGVPVSKEHFENELKRELARGKKVISI
jgi:hypothetical protein